MGIGTSKAGSSMVLALVCALGAATAEGIAAQAVSGTAYGALVNTPLAYQPQSVVAALPDGDLSTGEMNTAEAAGLSVPGALSSTFLNSTATGATGQDGASAQSVASLADLSILSGLITATEVVAVAASSVGGGTAQSSAAGSTFEDLVVRGVTVVSGDQPLAPNTRMSLPGVGYVVLNEQIESGDGWSSSGITVNMIHVVLTNALTGVKTGEIIVGSASSRVQ